MRHFAPLLFICACSSEPAKDLGITGVFDATQQLQAGNTATLRYWFTSDGKWGRAHRTTIGSSGQTTCASTADTSYELKGDKVFLRDGANTSERGWSLIEDNATLKLDPGDAFLNGAPANTFRRNPTVPTTLTCNTAFQ